MAMSENSRKVFEYMKGFVGQQTLTIESIAEACGLTAKSTNGTLLALSRHSLFERVPTVNEEGNVVKYIVPLPAINEFNPDTPSASDLKKSGSGNYSDTSKAIIKLLQTKVDSAENFTAKDIADALGLALASVNGSLTGLQKKGHIERMEQKAIIVDGVATNVRYIKVLPTISEITL